MKKSFLMISVLSIAATSFSPSIAATVEELTKEYHLAMEAGDEAWQGNRKDEAIKSYQSALLLLKQKQKEYPNHQKDLVEYRIGEVTKQLQELGNASTPALPVNDSASGDDQKYKDLYIKSKEDVVKMSAQLLEVEKTNVRLERNLRSAETTLDKQARELIALRKQIKDQGSGAQAEIVRLRKDLADKNKFNDLLQESNAQLKAINKERTATGQKLAAQLQAVTQELTATRQEALGLLKEIDAVKKVSENDIKFLREEKVKQKAYLDKVEGRAAELNKTIGELEEAIVSHEKEAAAQTEKFEGLNKALEEKGVEVAGLKEELLKQAAGMTGLTEEIAKHKESVETMGAERDEKVAAFEKLQGEFLTQSNYFAAAKIELAALTDFKTEREKLLTQISGHTNKVSKLEAAIAEFETQKSEWLAGKAATTSLEEQVESLEQTIDEMNATAATERKATEDASAALMEKLNTMTRLESELKAHKVTLADLEASSKNLQEKLSSVEGDLSEKVTALAEATENLDNLKGQEKSLLEILKGARNGDENTLLLSTPTGERIEFVLPENEGGQLQWRLLP